MVLASERRSSFAARADGAKENATAKDSESTRLRGIESRMNIGSNILTFFSQRASGGAPVGRQTRITSSKHATGGLSVCAARTSVVREVSQAGRLLKKHGILQQRRLLHPRRVTRHIDDLNFRMDRYHARGKFRAAHARHPDVGQQYVQVAPGLLGDL